MKNDRILLEKLIKETTDDTIIWVKADKPDYGYTSQYDKWKGEKMITENKHIVFILNYHVEDHKLSELRTFLINNLFQTRELIYDIDPGFFSFKTKKLLEKLINILNEKHKEQISIKVKEILGPMNKNWEEVIY